MNLSGWAVALVVVGHPVFLLAVTFGYRRSSRTRADLDWALAGATGFSALLQEARVRWLDGSVADAAAVVTVVAIVAGLYGLYRVLGSLGDELADADAA